jgi:hypothetical protein
VRPTVTGQCKVDEADLARIYSATGATNCPPPNAQFMYVNPNEVQPYFQLAEQYTFGDRMFSDEPGASFLRISSLFSDCFNFSQIPLAFTRIQGTQKVRCLLNDKSPPMPPDDQGDDENWRTDSNSILRGGGSLS